MWSATGKSWISLRLRLEIFGKETENELGRVMQSTQTTELTSEKVNQAINAILKTLGKPEIELHNKALTAFQNGDHQTVKRLASTNLSD